MGSNTADGTRGGIIVAWKGDEIEVSMETCNTSFVTVLCSHKKSGKSWRLVGVYGPQEDDAKLDFLRQLR